MQALYNNYLILILIITIKNENKYTVWYSMVGEDFEPFLFLMALFRQILKKLNVLNGIAQLNHN